MGIERRLYEPRGLPALVQSHRKRMAEISTRFRKAYALMYTPADRPELYRRKNVPGQKTCKRSMP